MTTVPTPIFSGASASFDEDSVIPDPAVFLTWFNIHTALLVTDVEIFRDGVLIDTVARASNHIIFQHYTDTNVTVGGVYNYSIRFSHTVGSVVTKGAGSKVRQVAVPLFPGSFTPTPDVDPYGPSVNKWTFTDVYEKGPAPYTYEFRINPNDGGSPSFDKVVNAQKVVGPNEMPVIQEGAPGAATMSFSGIILDREQYEAMEIWYRKRILLLVRDDLGRRFYGVFSNWAPQRTRRASNFWFHQYTAGMTIVAYYNASGQRVYGRFL